MTIDKEMIISDIKKIPRLMLAFLIIGYAIAQVKALDFGMAPWDTFALGILNKTGLEFGLILQSIGFIIVLFSIFVKIYPGPGTILNMIFIGMFVDLVSNLNITISPQSNFLKVLVLFYALIVQSFGLYYYLRVELGAGPRDGLLIGLVQLTGISVKYVKTFIESLVLLVGFLLGGTVGLGTVITTLCGGYILDTMFKWRKFDAKTTCQRKLTDYIVINKETESIKTKS